MKRLKVSFLCLAAAPLLSAALCAQKIYITDFKLEELDNNRTRISIAAKGEGADVGSYSLRLDSGPDGQVPENFHRTASGAIHLNEYSDARTSGLLRDNGNRDEDSRTGHFAYTLDSRDWKDGLYSFTIGAQNRPATGAYVGANRTFKIGVGEDLRTRYSKPGIELDDFKIEDLRQGRYRILLSASGADMHSYTVRIDNRGNRKIPKGFYASSNNYTYMQEGDRQSPYLMDNGSVDEDPRFGYFACTIDTSDWDGGRYNLIAAGQSGPGAPTYIAKTRGFSLDVGDKIETTVSNIPSAKHTTIFQEDGIYASFPSLLHLDNGVVAISIQAKITDNHVDFRGGNRTYVSHDEGRTWVEAADTPLYDVRWRRKDGTLVTAAAEAWLYTDSSQEARLAAENRLIMRVNEDIIGYLSPRLKVRTSTDNGQNWQSSYIDTDFLALMIHHAVATQQTLQDGTRLTVSYGKRYREDAPKKQGKDEPYILRSVDDGNNWEHYPMFPDGLPNPDIGFNETAIVQAADGTVIALMRSTVEDALWQSNSRDGGKTWSLPEKTTMLGFPAHVIRLKDNRLLAAYGVRRNDPLGVRAAISRDNGKTWDTENELIIRGDAQGKIQDIGYPVIFQRQDGDIVAIYYMTTDYGQSPAVYSTTFTLPE